MATVDPAVLQALGEVTIRFSVLESIVHQFTALLIGDQVVAGIILPGSTFGKVVDLAKKLYRKRESDEKLNDKFQMVCTNLIALSAERGKIVHAFWLGMTYETGATPRIIKESVDGLPEYKFDQVYLADLEDLAQRLTLATKSVTDFVVSFYETAKKMVEPNAE